MNSNESHYRGGGPAPDGAPGGAPGAPGVRGGAPVIAAGM